MSKRHMQHHSAVDGGASATDGYSPARKAPPLTARLLDLPPALLDDIACRVMQLGASSQLHLTCHVFSQACLRLLPALRIQLGRQCCDELLTPRVVAALKARPSKLALTLWQRETEDSMCYGEQLAPNLQLPQTEYTQDYTDLLGHALAKLDKCAAVEVKLVSSGVYKDDKRRHLRCSPGLAQQLLDSFPSLTALTLEGLCVSSKALASMLSHPPLALQLQQLHIARIIIPDGDLGAVVTLIQSLQLKQLSMAVVRSKRHGTPLLPSFHPLAQHLTQLHLDCPVGGAADVGSAASADYEIHFCIGLEGLTELLQALPQLHTLQLPGVTVSGQEQLKTLLATTQITSLQLGTVEGLDTTYADVPCSWQRLELTGRLGWKEIAFLPLHSLSQPLVLGHLKISVEDISDPEVAAALQRLAEAVKGPVQIMRLELKMLREEEEEDDDDDDDDDEEEDAQEGSGPSVISQTLTQQQRVELAQLSMWSHEGSSSTITSPLLQQQRWDLGQLVALLQPLQCCGEVVVHDLHKVTAADVLALAPLCQDCTRFNLSSGSVKPSLEFWRQLVQLMPAVRKVIFHSIKECDSVAMHESLQLMAQQPWARWLDITICERYRLYELPVCWQTGSWVKAGIFKVTMLRY